MARRKGSKNAGKPVAGKPAGAAPISGAVDENHAPVAGLDGGTAAADHDGKAANTGAAAGARLAGGTDAANADPSPPADTAGSAATETEGLTEAPQYRCHKQVRALKLTDITRNLDTGQVTLTPEDKSYAPFDAPPGWYERFHGSDNDTGYFVQYEDGFSSWSPTKPFEDGYSLMPADERDTLTFKSPLDIAELARGVAGAARFFADGAVGKPGLFDPEEADIMADFVRDNPDAPVPAMFIHLGLQKRYPRTEPNTADLFVLSLFHAACVAAIKFEADQAAEKAAFDAKQAPAGVWPGEWAMQPQQEAFAPTGFSPR